MDAEFRRLLEPIWPEERPAHPSADPPAGRPDVVEEFPVLDLEFTQTGAEGLEVLRLSQAQDERIAVAFIGLATPGWEEISVIERVWQLQPALPIVLCVAFQDQDWAGIIPHLGRRDRLLILQKPIDNLVLRQLAYSLIARTRAEQALLETRDQLVRCSRLAGMAEIAASVLHSVGNVLTSVNVSTGLIGDCLARTHVDGLTQLVEILPQDPAMLADFVRNDPRGKWVRRYLQETVRAMAGDQVRMRDELKSLTDGIDHLKQIVARQQDYARVESVVERVELAPLIGEVVRPKREALAEDGIRVVTSYEPILPASADRHRTLQIVINLVNNAVDALRARNAPGPARELHFGLKASRPGFVQLTVADNGVGIAPEHHANIFRFGFTTKPDGHGFGLHGSANDAKAMGGSLQMASDGAGAGATFTLELPEYPTAA